MSQECSHAISLVRLPKKAWKGSSRDTAALHYVKETESAMGTGLIPGAPPTTEAALNYHTQIRTLNLFFGCVWG